MLHHHAVGWHVNDAFHVALFVVLVVDGLNFGSGIHDVEESSRPAAGGGHLCFGQVVEFLYFVSDFVAICKNGFETIISATPSDNMTGLRPVTCRERALLLSTIALHHSGFELFEKKSFPISTVSDDALYITWTL